MDQELPTQLLPAVPHVTFSIFNIAIPNLIAWIIAVAIFFGAAWARLPHFLERGQSAEQTTSGDQSQEERPR
jgi:hypothetical protein